MDSPTRVYKVFNLKGEVARMTGVQDAEAARVGPARRRVWSSTAVSLARIVILIYFLLI